MAEKAESNYRNQWHFLLRSCLILALESVGEILVSWGILGVEFRLMTVNL
ncbi:hypothetical protein PMIT1303_01741 [Prochlorococcus sp. MIT 1303]|nr:hypothetical protein PMIT1303_01741 [Prochlorococcus sp. MIT 1303]